MSEEDAHTTRYESYKWPAVQSAIATSGYGVVYQNAVGGYLLAHLASSAPFGKFFPHGTFSRVSFQQRLKDWMLDDVVVDVQLADETIEHVAFQITLELDLAASDDKYRAVLGASLFTKRYSKPNYYGFITKTDTAALWRLTKSAWTRQDDPESWLKEVEMPNNFDQEVRRALTHLRNGLAPQMPDGRLPSARELVDFLERFLPVSLDVGGEADEQGVLLRQLLGQRYRLSDTNAQLLLDALVKTAEQGGVNRHSFDLDRLKKHVKRFHGPWLNELLEQPEDSSTRSTIAAATPRFAESRPQHVIIVENALIQQVESQGNELRKVLLNDIAIAENALRHADFAIVTELLEKAQRSPNWSSLSGEEKARVLLLDARHTLVGSGDRESALAKLQIAKSYFESGATLKFEAQLAIEDGDLDLAASLISTADFPWRPQVEAIIALNRNDDAGASVWLKTAPDDIETIRISSIALLKSGDRNAALAMAERGLAIDPGNDGMRNTFAVINFNCALIAGMHPVLGLTPAPVPYAYVRQDKVGKEHLKIASSILASQRRAGRRAIEIYNLDSWLMASIIVDNGRTADVDRLVSELLASRPGESLIIGWAHLYNVPFDRQAAIAALEELTKQLKGDIADVQALTWLYIDENMKSEARRLLNEYRDALREAGASALYNALFSSAGGDETEEGDLALPSLPESVESKRLKLSLDAEESGEWQPLIDFLRSEFDRTSAGTTLIDLATALRSAERWTDLSDLAPSLLLLGNQTGASCALQGLYNSNRLDEYVAAYGEVKERPHLDEQLPTLLRANASALERLGRLHDALTAWDAVYSRNQPGDRPVATTAMLRIYSTLGDVVGVKQSADRMLLAKEQGTDLLAAASLALATARDAAISLWRAAVANIPDEAVPAALSLGYKLGLDAEPTMESLTQRLETLAARGEAGVQRITIDELPEKLQQWRDSAQFGFNAYMRGEVPVHTLFSTVLPGQLSDFWDAAFTGKGQLFCRFAGRSRAFGFDHKIREDVSIIALDTTALLTLQHAGVLSHVLADDRVRFSQTAIVAIEQMRNATIPAQPAVIEKRRRLAQRFQSGSIMLAKEKPQSALGVDALNDLPSFVGLIHGMHRLGFFTGDVNTKLTQIGLGQVKSNLQALELPESIFLDGLALNYLEDGDLLDSLVDKRLVFASETTKFFVDREVADANDRRRKAEWLNDLHTVLIAVGGSRIIPNSIEDADPDLATRALMSIIRQMDGADSIIVADDRLITSFTTTDKLVPITTTFELAQFLWQSSNPEVFKTFTNRLRAANAFFIPIGGHEIASALIAAPIDNTGSVIETPELSQLRRYVAEAIARRDFMRRPTSIQNVPFPLGETPYLMDLSRVSTGALEIVWRTSEVSGERKAAYGIWILEMLYVDDLPEVHIMRTLAPERSDAEVVATGLAMLIYRAMSLVGDKELAHSYLEFLTLRLFRNRLRLDPHVAPMLARQISDAFHATVSTGKEDGNDPRLAIVMIHRLLMELPKAIQELLSADSSLKEILQLESVSSVVIDHVRFESDLLWDAIAKCIASGTEQIVSSLLPAIQWTINSLDHNVMIASAGRQLVISDSALGVSAADDGARRKFLQNIAATFDLSGQDLDVTIDGIARSQSPAEFMNRLSAARLNSLEFKAATLAEQIVKGTMEIDSAIHSDDEDILHYLRLASVDIESQESYQNAGGVLLVERNINEAILRYALLPIPLPENIAKAWQTQTKLARKQSAEHLCGVCKSSIEKMHLRRLFATSDFVGRAKMLKTLDIDLLSARDGADIQAELAVVEWVRRVLIVNAKNGGKNQGGAELLLSAWTFGGLLYRHLLIRKVTPKALSELFERLAEPTLRILFGRGESNAGNPRHQPSDYVAHIFAYAYEENPWPLTAPVKAGWREFFVVGKLPAALPRAGIRSWAQPADLLFTMMAYDIRPTLVSQLPEIADLYGDENRSALLAAVLGRLAEDQSDGLMWAFVPMLADLLSTEQLDELRHLFGEINLAQLIMNEHGRRTTLIAIATPRILESGESRAKLRALVLSTATALSAEAESGARGLISVEDRERVALLQECAMRIAIASDNSERLQAEAYVALAREMGVRWPKIFQVLAPHVVEYSKTLPLEQSAPFGMLILDCRRTA